MLKKRQIIRNIRVVIGRDVTVLLGVSLIIWGRPFSEASLLPCLWGIPIPLVGRWGLFLLGCFFICEGAFNRKPKHYKDITKYEDAICPVCTTVYKQGRGPSKNECIKCHVQLEPLEGFYDRYPELKNVKEKLPKNIKDFK